MKGEALFSSKTGEWETPRAFFDVLDAEFHFTLDPCCNEQNKKCEKHYTKEQDGLKQSWAGERVFCNPPYGRDVGKWIQKSAEEKKRGALVVLLLPARVDTKWFHELIVPNAEIRFVKGRLKFGGKKESAPFPSMVAIMRPECAGGDMGRVGVM